MNEEDVSLECHIVADDVELVHKTAQMLDKKFEIRHCNIQIEKSADCEKCCL